MVEMMVPLFSYNPNGGEIDVNCLTGDVCCVMNVTTSENDFDIDRNREKMSYLIGIGKKIIDISSFNAEDIRELMSFVDLILSDDRTKSKHEWNNLYSILDAVYQTKKTK